MELNLKINSIGFICKMFFVGPFFEAKYSSAYECAFSHTKLNLPILDQVATSIANKRN